MKTFLSALALSLVCITSVNADWPINDVCPIDQKPARPIFRTKTNDGPVAFCCADCKDKFEKSPSSYPVKKK